MELISFKKMAPRTKYEDTPVDDEPLNGKVFMYCTPGWDILYPIVDIIRLLKKRTVISFRYGKGQQIIKTYGDQYSHRIVGYEINKKNDYIEALRMVKCVFIFTDSADTYAENFILFAKNLKILLVCYSNLDKVYHFYSPDGKTIIKTAKETIEHVYLYFDEIEAKRFVEMFPDFELIEPPVEQPKQTVLEECIAKLKVTTINEQKKKELNTTKVYDPHLAKIKKMENERKKEKYPDEPKKKAINIFSMFN